MTAAPTPTQDGKQQSDQATIRPAGLFEDQCATLNYAQVCCNAMGAKSLRGRSQVHGAQEIVGARVGGRTATRTNQHAPLISAFNFTRGCSLHSAHCPAVAHATTHPAGCGLAQQTAGALTGALCEQHHTSPSTMTLDAMPPDMLYLIMR